MPMRYDAVEFVPQPPGLEGEGVGNGLGIQDIETRLLVGWKQSVAEGRITSPKNLQPIIDKAPEALVLPEVLPSTPLRPCTEYDLGSMLQRALLQFTPPVEHEEKTQRQRKMLAVQNSFGGSGLFCPECSTGHSSTCPFHTGPVPVPPRQGLMQKRVQSEPVRLRPAQWSVSRAKLGLCSIEEGSDHEGSTDAGQSCCAASDSVKSDDDNQPKSTKPRWSRRYLVH